MRNKKKLLILAIFILLFLSGCANNFGEDGLIRPERIISLSTTWGDVFNTDGWFEVIFVWPVAQLINFLNTFVGVAFAVALATVIINMLTLPITIRSTVASQKMQMVKPEMDKINKKYEGRNDQHSMMQKNAEMQKIYQKHNIKPLAAMGMILTMPIMIAMWQAVQRAEAVATGTFMGMNLEITPWQGIMDGHIGYIIIFALMGVAQFISMKIPSWLAKRRIKEDRSIKEYDAPKKKKGQPGDKMVLFMWPFIMFISATMPTAMSFFWMSSATVMILKNLYIDKFHIGKGEPQ